MTNNWNTDQPEGDLDELDTYLVSDKEATNDSDDVPFEDPWETEPGHIPDIHLKRLDEIIGIGYPGKSDDKSRTGGVVCPRALDLAWREIKHHGHNWTKAKVQRISIYHGLRMAYKDDRIKALNRAYNKLMNVSKSTDDDDLIHVLADRKVFSFRDPNPKTTSMGTLVFLEGAISDLSDSLGIAKSSMYPVLSLLSIMSYEPPVWRASLGKEYRSFWKAVEERCEKIEKESRRVADGENKQLNGKTVKQQNGKTLKQQDN